MSVNTSEDFIELMTSFQGRLYGYILSLLADPNVANDILQETNIILWQKSAEFKMGSNFKAWSFRIANFKVMAHRQRQMRDKLVFDDDFMNNLTIEANTYDETYEEKQKILTNCILFALLYRLIFP